jgi:two-component system cell cycle response regulator DivK
VVEKPRDVGTLTNMGGEINDPTASNWPRAGAGHSLAAAVERFPARDAGAATILLVEDNPVNRSLCRAILQFRFDVVEAESAEAALQLLESFKPDLILLDIELPGMDGIALVRSLKAQTGAASIPVIALSALAMPRDIETARQAGCVDYITKPITDDPFVFLDRVARPLAGGD